MKTERACERACLTARSLRSLCTHARHQSGPCIICTTLCSSPRHTGLLRAKHAQTLFSWRSMFMREPSAGGSSAIKAACATCTPRMALDDAQHVASSPVPRLISSNHHSGPTGSHRTQSARSLAFPAHMHTLAMHTGPSSRTACSSSQPPDTPIKIRQKRESVSFIESKPENAKST